MKQPRIPVRQSASASWESPAAAGDELADALARLHQQTQLWQSFLAVHRQIIAQLADEMLTEHQLPLEWFDVLVHLADIPGMRARQKELRDRILLSESGVSRLLARMEKAGVITRRTAGDDLRGLEIAVTDAGRAALLAAIDSHLELVASLFTSRLTATDHAALSKALPKLLAIQEPAGRRSARAASTGADRR
jgi:DNA-binding MarR family transcriptional regulator